MENKTHASDGQHWYDSEGNPVYTVKAKNGNDRNATLADARKMNLKPGVTTIINLMASPALNAWIAEQLLMSALTTTRREILKGGVIEPECEADPQ